MKKNGIVLLGVFVFLLSGIVIAQNEDLARLNVSFCTGEVDNALSYMMDGGEEQELCYVMSNGSASDLDVNISFVDGVYTNDERKNRACMLDTQISYFGQYVTGYEKTLSLKAGESITGTAVLRYPTDTHGIFHGCLAYSIVSANPSESKNGANFAIQMRRAKFVDVLVGDLDKMGQGSVIFDDFTVADGKNFSRNPKIRVHKDPLDGKYIISYRLKNMGVFDEEVVLTGMLSDLLANRDYFVTERRMIKGDTLLFSHKLDKHPLYAMRVKLQLAHTPMLIGDLQAETYISNESALIFVWDITTILTLLGIIVVVLIIVLLVKDLRKKSKPSKKIIPAKKKKTSKKRK